LDEQDDDVVLDADGPPTMPLEADAPADAGDAMGVPARSLGDSDLRFIRALEDVIELLDRKGVIAESELPPPVQELLAKRRNMREILRELRSTGALDDF
ncbi:MAG: hypothetical protein AAF684_09445, partial [Pseudomonadota bacterium]